MIVELSSHDQVGFAKKLAIIISLLLWFVGASVVLRRASFLAQSVFAFKGRHDARWKLRTLYQAIATKARKQLEGEGYLEEAGKIPRYPPSRLSSFGEPKLAHSILVVWWLVWGVFAAILALLVHGSEDSLIKGTALTAAIVPCGILAWITFGERIMFRWRYRRLLGGSEIPGVFTPVELMSTSIKPAEK
jgi:hypothetical protein